MSDPALIREILSQIIESTERIKRRFASIQSRDDFVSSDEGIDRLDGICMMLISMGENLKNLDKLTKGELAGIHKSTGKAPRASETSSAIIIIMLTR